MTLSTDSTLVLTGIVAVISPILAELTAAADTYRRDLPRRQLLPLALFSATGLPLIVVITTIGVQEGRMRPVNAAALVVAGMLSVLLFPMFAKIRLGPAHRTRPAEAESRLVSGVARAGLH